jgi:hypothetical protein
MMMRREQLTKAEAVTIAAIETNIRTLAAAYALLDGFCRMLRSRDAAALTELWSNRQTEGQNTKLKLVKRQIWSRAAGSAALPARRRSIKVTTELYRDWVRAPFLRRITV